MGATQRVIIRLIGGLCHCMRVADDVHDVCTLGRVRPLSSPLGATYARGKGESEEEEERPASDDRNQRVQAERPACAVNPLCERVRERR